MVELKLELNQKPFFAFHHQKNTFIIYHLFCLSSLSFDFVFFN